MCRMIALSSINFHCFISQTYITSKNRELPATVVCYSCRVMTKTRIVVLLSLKIVSVFSATASETRDHVIRSNSEVLVKQNGWEEEYYNK